MFPLLGSPTVVVLTSCRGVVRIAVIIEVDLFDSPLQDGHHVIERAESISIVITSLIRSIYGNHSIVTIARQ